MAIAMEEDYLGRSGNKNNRRLKFVVTGTDDDAAARAYVEANVPSTHDGLVARVVSNIEQLANERWRFTVDYGALSLFDIPTADPGTASYTFFAQVEPEVFYYSVDRIGRWPSNAPNVVNGMVGIKPAHGGGLHAGIEVPAGPVTDRVTYEYPAAVIPQTYRNTVRSLIGRSNANTFLGSPPGTMRFVTCSASITSTGKQTIDFGFAYRSPQVVKIGNHNLGTVQGWDSVWSIDQETTLTGPDGREWPFVKPEFVYVERFVKQAPFGGTQGLGLPAF